MTDSGAVFGVDTWQHRLDTVRATAPHRWALSVLAVLAAGVAAHTAAASAYGWSEGSPLVLGVIVALAVGAAVRPESGLGVAVIAAVTWRWLAVPTADAMSAHVVLVACSLLLFHVTVSLMAATPPDATIPPPVFRRWGARTAVVAAATVAVWALAAAMSSRSGSTETALTVAAFAALASATLALRARR